MMNIDRTRRTSRGSIKTVAALVLLICALFVAIVLNGSLNQDKQQTLLDSAYESFNQGNYSQAYEKFNEARSTFSFTLKAYRIVRSGEYLSLNDLGEISISTCLTAAYDSFFKLETAPDWVSRAKELLPVISDLERQRELEKLVKTAGEVSQLCQNFADGEIEKALKAMKDVEQGALAGDQDFFIFEIRFLIACGKALQEPVILNQARELLFFATTDAGINNDKTQRLWGILTN